MTITKAKKEGNRAKEEAERLTRLGKELTVVMAFGSAGDSKNGSVETSWLVLALPEKLRSDRYRPTYHQPDT